MCILLYRRYICPKAPDFKPLDQQDAQRSDHPKPSAAIPNHHLLLEDRNVFRENAEDPDENVPEGYHIHWVGSWIRCAHLHHEQCVKHMFRRGESTPMKLQYFKGPCTYCTGDVDMHFENESDIETEIETHPRIPILNDPDHNLDGHFEAYKEHYLSQLLGLFLSILKKRLMEKGETTEWVEAIRNAWPEVWCKLEYGHMGHLSHECDCRILNKEWRVNTAFSMRKNEAMAILDRADKVPDGGVETFSFEQVYDEDEDGNHVVAYWVQQRAEDLYDKFPEEGYPRHQMEYVKLSDEVYTRRLTRLLQLSVRCRAALSERGQQVSEAYPASATFSQTRRISWMGLDNWDNSLNRRQRFLDWAYRFLARDAGLDEEVMVYFGGALLAILNPWPNNRYRDHPSHPQPQVLDPDLVAWEKLQECMYWLEYHWPLDGMNIVMASLIQSTRVTEGLIDIIERNREIEEQDMALRNDAADYRTSMFSVPVEQAIAEGSTECVCCQHEWNDYPCHEPVKMPCCRSYIGRRCLKQDLALKKIRGQTEQGMPTWAANWSCMLCRGLIGEHFAPPIDPNYHEQQANIQHVNFYNHYTSQPREPAFWDYIREFRSGQI